MACSSHCSALIVSGIRHHLACSQPVAGEDYYPCSETLGGTLTSHELHRKGQKKNPGQQLDDVDMLTI